jgi:hypothetical protein
VSDLLQQLTLGPEAAKLTGLSIHAAKTNQGADVTVVRLEDRPGARQAFSEVAEPLGRRA